MESINHGGGGRKDRWGHCKIEYTVPAKKNLLFGKSEWCSNLCVVNVCSLLDDLKDDAPAIG